MLDKCELCPRACKVNRLNGELGFCKASDKVKVALVSTHYFEEPCISGELGENQKGSGTIFFSNCNLRCMFCQNYEISHEGKGIEITTDRLAEIMIEQQERGVNNINLVTPTIYVYQIIDAIKKAKAMGLHIPIVYNTCAYETVETIKMLDGLIDIYLPDLKYYADNIAIKYSTAPHYFENATAVIKEMQRQVGENVFDENGIMQKGMIIRHLILPNHIQNTKHVLKWIKENMPEGTYVSVMAQYFPTYKANEDESINRKINQKEYDEVETYLGELDLENGYIQELGKHEEEYVPNFDFSNIEKSE
jgi:putative pyruvate formate lyase activating enzyme